MSLKVATRMRKSGAWWWMGVIGLISCQAIHAQMSIPGSFAVSPSGAATYSIPIQVPPGVAGMEPKLALSYNSQAGNGLLGVGWSLSGLSAITRCPQTVVQDGSNVPVSYKSTDRFCLDGQRLMLLPGASYGADGSEYRTEGESFSQIKAYNVSGVTTSAGPAKFIVKTKSGLTMEFGNTVDARVFASPPNDKVVSDWAINKIFDRAGNAIELTYTWERGRFWPKTIAYSGGGLVTFHYGVRSDIQSVYVEGGVIRLPIRLTNVSVKLGNTSREYNIGYSSGDAGRSLLSNLSVCVLNGACQPSISFNYSDGKLVAWGNKDVSGHGVGDQGWDVADIFGDGADVYWTHNSQGTHFATRVNADGTATNWSWDGQHGVGDGGWRLVNAFGNGKKVYWSRQGTTHYITQLNKDGTAQSWTYTNAQGIGDGGYDFVDLFGDGREVYWTRNGSMHYATRFNPDGTMQNWVWSGQGVGESGSRFVNLFGDGRKVYWTRNGSTHFASRFNDNGTVENWSWSAHGQGTAGFEFADIFGEGRDIYWTRTDATHYASRFNADGTVQNWTWTGVNSIGNGGSRFVNLFGDGRKVYWTRNDATHYATRLNADGTAENWVWAGHGLGDLGWGFADIYGDGRDTYWTFNSVHAHFSSRFYPDGTVKNESWNGHTNGADGWRFVDFVGNGKKVYWTHTNLTHYTTSPVLGEVDLLLSVKQDASTLLSITYSRLPELEWQNNGRFIRNLSVSLPRANLGAAMAVVDTSASPDGIGGARATQYSYANLLFEGGAKGRGGLGFQWTQTKDLGPTPQPQGFAGLINRTCYRQDHPYIGMVSQSVQGTSDAGWPSCGSFTSATPNVLTVTTNTYAAKVYTSGSIAATDCADSCAITAGQRYFIYPAQSTTQSWDWDGTTFIALPQNRTSQTYGDWGNALMVKAETLKPDGTVSGYAKTTISQYSAPDTTNWILGRVVKTTVQADAP